MVERALTLGKQRVSSPAASLVIVVESVSAAQARRIALAAQGFGKRPAAVSTRQINATIQRLNLLQLDSINVYERSHYLPLFARLGTYDKSVLDRLTFGRRSKYIEYWAHEAAIIPAEDWPLWRWKMEQLRERDEGREQWVQENGQMLQWLRDELAARGPVAASQIEHDSNKRAGPWWGWSDVKRGLEYLFRWGDAVSAGRTRFERSYALPGQILSGDLLERSVSREDAHRQLVERSAVALGIATAIDLADYFRLKSADVRPAIATLADAGVLLPVTVRGWSQAAWLHRDARIPRRIETEALLSPFDPVVWDRARALRMFGFHYRIEVYTPAPKRIYGYYTLPLLIDDALVGRIDLKSDRQAGVLRVQSAWREGEAFVDLDRVVALLDRIAAWQGLGGVEFAERGDLIGALAQHYSAV